MTGTDSTLVPIDHLREVCAAALRAAGGSPEVARVLTHAAAAAEARGRSSVGAGHLLDHVNALREGRLNGHPAPQIVSTFSAVMTADADAGPVQLVFEQAREALVHRAREAGLAVLSVRNGFTAGELAHYAHLLADDGLVSLVCANSPALMSVFGSTEPLTGTNPLAFGLPHPSGARVFDQASSEIAWVSIRDAADRGEAIPPGWAADATGRPTTDAAAALAGALLPFGGAKGSNIAIMVEMLATLSGGAFSLDAPPFDRGDASPGTGVFVLALAPEAFDPGFAERAEAHLSRLAHAHGADFGRRRAHLTRAPVPGAIWRALGEAAASGANETCATRT